MASQKKTESKRSSKFLAPEIKALLASVFDLGGEHAFDISQFCFKEQYDFIRDPAKYKTAVCSRRSGKTVACAAHLVSDALKAPRRISLYITLSRLNAKRIIWNEILSINQLYSLGGKANDAELSMTFPNGSIIYLSGAKDKSEIEKFRGLALSLVYIDETQAFRSYIEELIDDVLSKALFDYNGSLCLIGTPGPVPSGYFYRAAHSPEWSHHGWTLFQNPFLPQKSGRPVQELIDQDLKRMGVTIEHPRIQRECFGRWVVDLEALVFQYNEARNSYSEKPSYPSWQTVIGIDLGFDDADAIAVLGWGPHEKKVYLLEECVTPKQGITELAKQIDRLMKVHAPLRIVMDTGGLGKKIAEEIRKRYEIPIQAAEKARKFEFIELLNDALRTSRFFVPRASVFAQDALLVEWDRDHKDPDKLKISDRYHSDIADATLYAYREALHWLSEPEVERPQVYSAAWYQAQVRQMEEMAEAQVARDREKEESLDFW